MGPITVAVDASSAAFKFYKSGIFSHADKCGTDLNHAITLVGYNNTSDQSYWIVRNSWGTDWGENGYIRMAILGGDGVCGINLEPTFPNIFYLNVFDSGVYVGISIAALVFSLWPLIKLSWCKSEELLYLHEGQKGLVKVAFAMTIFYIVALILFSITLGPPPLPAWMIYRTGIIFMYGFVHIFICMLHHFMGLFDRLNGEQIRESRGFSLIKTYILSFIMFIVTVVAFSLLLVENQPLSSYPDDDEEYAKFEKRHTVNQMRNMMVSINVTCLIMNGFFVHNLTKMVSRPSRAKGSTSQVHYTALVFAVISIILTIGIIIALYFPAQI